jgi:hypothetical protein
MTAALRTDLNDFLFAPIADDANGMPLTMLSALARLGVDPWTEAADLSVLSRDSATQKLTSMLATVPNGPSPGADTATLAARLVELLHARPKKPASTAGVMSPAAAASFGVLAAQPKRVKWAIYSLLALIAIVVGNWALTDRQVATPADTSLPVSR